MYPMDWEERQRRLDRLAKFKKPPRYPTQAEQYLTNFWVPAVGNIVFSAEEAPGEEYKILEIDKKYQEQALVKNVDNKPEILFLQDWHWAPQTDDLDDILQRFGVQILNDCVARNRVMLAKPKTPEEYVKVIRAIRKHGYESGDDLLKRYFNETKGSSEGNEDVLRNKAR